MKKTSILKRVCICMALAFVANMSVGCEALENFFPQNSEESSTPSQQTVSYDVVKVVESGEGTIDAPTKATKGENVTITLRPDSGYYLSNLVVNGVNVTANVVNNQYTVENVSQKVKISATYSPGVVYASTQKKPVIDGRIDENEIWNNAVKFYAENSYPNDNQTGGYYSLAWDEDNLYLLAVVEDTDITTYDQVNFWIAETYIEKTEEDIGIRYSNNPTAGTYYTVVTSDGVNRSAAYNNGIDFDIVEGFEFAALIDDSLNFYTVEIKIPKQSTTTYEAGHSIGFDGSIDFYSTRSGSTRDSYRNIFGYGWYWEFASHLEELKLIK